MKYQVTYTKQKKNKTSRQIATFYKLEDAALWEKHIISQGYQDSQVIPVFSE
jgi:hypothetical protein